MENMENDDGSGAKAEQISLLLDGDTLAYFRRQAEEAGIAYRTLIRAWLADSAASQLPQGAHYLNPEEKAWKTAETALAEDFVLVAGGTFTMGSPETEPLRNANESPRQVKVSSFYMEKCTVTQAEYEAVAGVNPASFQEAARPVENVSWYDAVEYCNLRSRAEGLRPAYTIDRETRDSANTNAGDSVHWTVTWDRQADGYRLPTEAEWEYACRAGTATPFSTGENIGTDRANYDGRSPYNGGPVGEQRQGPWAAGSGWTNAWGLSDMHGNVWEWCWDWFGDYGAEDLSDPAGAPSGTGRVDRGGSWFFPGLLARSAHRNGDSPSYRSGDLGFRLVRNVPH